MNTKSALAGRKTFFLSAPSLNQNWDSALAPLEAYRGLQCLLGWDAQLIGFGAMLRRAGLDCLVTPAPELFFTQTSRDAAARSAGSRTLPSRDTPALAKAINQSAKMPRECLAPQLVQADAYDDLVSQLLAIATAVSA